MSKTPSAAGSYDSGFSNMTKGDLANAELGFQTRKSNKKSYVAALVVSLFIICGLTAGIIYLGVDRNRSLEHGQVVELEGENEYCMTEGCLISGARIANGIDSSIDPCEDFYEFACGQWRRKHIIPEDRARWTTMDGMNEDVEVTLKYILESQITPNDNDAIKKAKLFYKACMNENATEHRGIGVISPLLQELGGWPLLGNTSMFPTWNESDFNLSDLILKFKKYNNDPIIEIGVTTDLKNSTRRILEIDQPSFGLPSREYFLRGRGDPIVEAYAAFIERVAGALGADPNIAKKDINDIVSLEIDLANISDTRTFRRNSTAIYNLFALDELQSEFPTEGYLNWQPLIRKIMRMDGVKIELADDEPVIVFSTNYLQNVFDVLQNYQSRTIANFMLWTIIRHRTGQLPREIREMREDLNKVLSGTATAQPWWKTCSSFANDNLGMAVGRLFVEETFDEDAKTNALDLIKNLKGAFKELIEELDWMDEDTRRVAVEKLDFIQNRVGYPDDILDDEYLNTIYENVTALPDNHFKNYLNNLRRTNIDSLSRLRDPVNKNGWTVTPSTVNAFYSPSRNTISFPAAFLQPPYYSKTQPNYLNFGGIGLVIGHEMTHGFDDSGRQYDKYGNLKQWWSDEVVTKFEERANCIKDQYGNYVVERINHKLNGELTLGENIADNGGIKQAFKAYRKWVEVRGAEEPSLFGLNMTNNQLLFVNFAQGLCRNIRPQFAMRLVLTDPHSPGRYRIIGSVQNSEDFAREFGCKKNSPMNPEQKCAVW